jgi:NAD(P)H-dependent FMN reductase
MITVISGTNRPNSRTQIIATAYLNLLKEMGEEVQLLDMVDVDTSEFLTSMYSGKTMGKGLKAMQERFVIDAEKLAFCVPEYNGSYPGIVKLFIDGISINEYPQNFKGKVTGLIGVASGRSGNIRGMDHLASSIEHMGGWVLPNKLPVSSVESLLNPDDELVHANTIEALKQHALQLIAA